MNRRQRGKVTLEELLDIAAFRIGRDFICWHSNPSSANISRRRTFDENTIPHEDSESYLADNNKVVIIGANGTMGAGAGFKLNRIVPTQARVSVIEGLPA